MLDNDGLRHYTYRKKLMDALQRNCYPSFHEKTSFQHHSYEDNPVDIYTMDPVQCYDKSKSVSFVLFTANNRLIYDTETLQYKMDYLSISPTANWVRAYNKHPITMQPVLPRFLNRLGVFETALGEGLRLPDSDVKTLDLEFDQFQSDPDKYKSENSAGYQSLFTQYANNINWFAKKDQNAKKFLEADYVHTASKGFAEFVANRHEFKQTNPYVYALLRRDFYIDDANIISNLRNTQATEIRKAASQKLSGEDPGSWLIRKSSVVSNCPLISVRVLSIVKHDKTPVHRLFGFCMGYGYFDIKQANSGDIIDESGFLLSRGMSIFSDDDVTYCSFLDYLEAIADNVDYFKLEQMLMFE